MWRPSKPALKFNGLLDQSDKDEKEGFIQLSSGANSGSRNPRTLGFVNDDPERALEFVAFVSLLAKLLDWPSHNLKAAPSYSSREITRRSH
ncbi:TIGR02391 family protein [Mesorhizobium sp. ORM6]